MASGVLDPMESFPSLWAKIEGLIGNERLKMSEVVFEEAMRDEVLKREVDLLAQEREGKEQAENIAQKQQTNSNRVSCFFLLEK